LCQRLYEEVKDITHPSLAAARFGCCVGNAHCVGCQCNYRIGMGIYDDEPSTATPLLDIFASYGTDKGVNGYAPIYEALFRHQRRRITSVLEVGIGTMIPNAPSSMVGWALPGYAPGGGLRAWRDWFPNAEVMGLDIQHDTLFTEQRIETRLCDTQQASEVAACLGAPGPIFDLVIDDGDHTARGQLLTCANIYPYLADGGYYIIEDTWDLPLDTAAMEELAGLTEPSARFVVTWERNNLRNNLIVISKP
jgi:hypothetical protein